jgi:thiosulfate sulfurtransferase
LSEYRKIDIAQACALIDQGAQVVDIRDEASFNQRHIRDATHLGNHNLPQFLAQAAFDQPLIVCCYHGISSQPAAAYLAEQGFEQVYSLEGGFEAWRSQCPDRCSG